MRRKTLLALALTLILGLCSCGSAETESVPGPESVAEPEATGETETIATSEPAAESEPEAEQTPETTTETTEENKMTYEIDPTKPMIALTFDDGPNTTTTVQILDILEEYDVRASFFVIGDNINEKSGEVMKRAYDMGCEINNHSKTHQNMPSFTADEIKAEIEYTSNKVEEITGEPTKFFRPPYIAVNNTMYDAIDLPFICGYGCNDWETSVTAEMRATKTLEQAEDGAIILLHDFYGNSATVEALKTIIPELLEQGYQFVTVGELFEAKGVEIKADDKNLYTVVK